MATTEANNNNYVMPVGFPEDGSFAVRVSSDSFRITPHSSLEPGDIVINTCVVIDVSKIKDMLGHDHK